MATTPGRTPAPPTGTAGGGQLKADGADIPVRLPLGQVVEVVPVEDGRHAAVGGIADVPPASAGPVGGDGDDPVEGAAVTVRYSTRSAPVGFRGSDFGRSGSNLSSIRFSSMPASTAGHLYYRYTSPTRYDRQASTASSYNVSGTYWVAETPAVMPLS